MTTTSLKYTIPDINYPDGDGLPMAESDATRDYLIYSVEALTTHFQNDANTYVSGNLFVYYEQGNPKAVVAPDVLVVFGIGNKKRLSYKVWEENHKVPDFILEITSKSTASEDRGTKKGLYAYLGVKEYFQYDPRAEYLQPSLQGFRLVEGSYLAIPCREDENGLSVFSQVLGLELQRLPDQEMRFYNPTKKEKLLSPQETEQARRIAEQALSLAERARELAEAKTAKLADKLRQLGINPDSI